MLKKHSVLSGWCIAYIALCAATVVVSLCGAVNAAMYIAMAISFLPFGPTASAICIAVAAKRGNDRRIPLIWLAITVAMWMIAIMVLVSSTGGV